MRFVESPWPFCASTAFAAFPLPTGGMERSPLNKATVLPLRKGWRQSRRSIVFASPVSPSRSRPRRYSRQTDVANRPPGEGLGALTTAFEVARASWSACGKRQRDTAVVSEFAFKIPSALDSGVVEASCPCLFATALHDAGAFIRRFAAPTSADPSPPLSGSRAPARCSACCSPRW